MIIYVHIKNTETNEKKSLGMEGMIKLKFPFIDAI